MPSKNLLKTKKDHRRLRAMLTENTVALTMTPNAGALPGGNVGQAYNATFALSNAVGGSRFRLASGSFPTGLALNADTGVLSGNPSAAVNNRAFSIEGTDDFGNTKAQAYTLTIAA